MTEHMSSQFQATTDLQPTTQIETMRSTATTFMVLLASLIGDARSCDYLLSLRYVPYRNQDINPNNDWLCLFSDVI